MENIFSLHKEHNTLSIILRLLKVKHTSTYVSKYFNEHPDKYNMFGLSKMLSHFGIFNKGMKTANKEKDISALEAPFIAQIEGELIVVDAIDDNNIAYYWNGEKIYIPLKEFINIWTGVVLVFEADENSIEPNYKEGKKRELAIDIFNSLLSTGIFVLVVIGFIEQNIYQSIALSALLILSIIGGYIGYLLVLKQMSVQSSHADKICSLFSQSDCNNILDTDAAKFMGVIGWSELGLSYFISNIFIILFAPHILPYMILLNTLALGYSFWSIWYQKFVAKQWCPLCIIVQIIFWCIFIVTILSGLIHVPIFHIIDILSVGLIYGVPFLIITLLLPSLSVARKHQSVTQEYNRLKMNDNVFNGQLKEQVHYQVDKNDSTILFGNPDSDNIITIFTNPHCGPCARMHTRVEAMLSAESPNICIQYILSSFNQELDSSCIFLLFINDNYPSAERDKIYSEWFEVGQAHKEEIFAKYNFSPDSTSEEYQKHIDWKDTTKLRTTPTILINGFKIPENYKLEDITYFTNLSTEEK